MDADQEAAASIFAWVRSWFTPTVLFLLLNLIVGTIFTTSYAFSKNQSQDGEEHQQQQQEPQPTVLSRLRSIGSLYRNRSGEIALPGPQEAAFDDAPALDRDQDHQSGWSQPETRPPPPTVLSRLRSFGSLYRYRSDEIALPGPPEPAADFVPARDHQYGRSRSETREAAAAAEGKMARSSSSRAAGEEEKEEVDARADDFINRFRDQLRLQRLDSFLRYKDMLSNGGR